ncbi:MAG TPA: DsbA family protein [Dongiaceae bacterium]|jgi:protein-disulfide isomerase|nr:DsbA family protein [Dongiaceae bacterium]
MSDQPKRSRKFSAWIALIVALLAAIAAWVVFDPGFYGAGLAMFTPGMSQEEFDRRVHDYVMNNPEVIIQAVQGLEARKQREELTGAQDTLKARADEIFRDSASPVGGNAQGDVTLVEFFDYNCPYCRKMAPVLTDAEKADPQLRIVFKEFPILGPASEFAARAALAAQRQMRYEAFHHALMAVKEKVDENNVLTTAASVGLDVERLKTDMQDPAIQAVIDRNMALAAALRINGTPGFVIGDQILRGATELNVLQGMISQARKQK